MMPSSQWQLLLSSSIVSIAQRLFPADSFVIPVMSWNSTHQRTWIFDSSTDEVKIWIILMHQCFPVLIASNIILALFYFMHIPKVQRSEVVSMRLCVIVWLLDISFLERGNRRRRNWLNDLLRFWGFWRRVCWRGRCGRDKIAIVIWTIMKVANESGRTTSLVEW